MNRRFQIYLKWSIVIGICLLAGSLLHSQIPEPPKPRSPDFAAHLEKATNALKKIAADLPNMVPVPKTWDGSIKYYKGTSSSLYREMMYGHSFGTPDDAPPIGQQSYAAFYFGRDGRLHFVVRYLPDAEPYVSEQILYHDQTPIACVSYYQSRRPLIDYVHYEKDVPVIACRLLPDGEVVLVEEPKPTYKAQSGDEMFRSEQSGRD